MEHFERPKMTVLPASALVPDANLVRPPPTHFTHELASAQPYFYAAPDLNTPPDGAFAAGTKVVLTSSDDGPFCRVIDGRGLHVSTALSGLRPLK